MNTKKVFQILMILGLIVAISGCTGEDKTPSPVMIKIDQYTQDGGPDEEGAATVNFKLTMLEGSGTTYVALFVPTAFNVDGNIRDKSYSGRGYSTVDDDRYEVFMVENDAFEYSNTPAQEYTVGIRVDLNQLASKDRRNTILRVYWREDNCIPDGGVEEGHFDLSCYVLLDESKKSISIGK